MGADGGRSNTPVKNYGWGTKTTVEDWLFDEGHRFDFFQAVRLLEIIHKANGDDGPTTHRERLSAPGHGADPTKEIVQFRSAVKLDFPASDIAHVKRKQDIPKRDQPTAPAEMTVNFLGLAGCLGALDIPSTELVLERASHNDKALGDFLDIFNHRLVSLLYRIRKHHRVGLVSGPPGDDHVANYLYSLIGLATPGMQGRMHIRDRALLHYAGILAQQPRSMAGLKQILTDYFQVGVKIVQLTGKWCDLEEDQWTTIGESGKNQRLGRDTVVLGTRVWDQHGRFEVHLGPLSRAEFENFLPTEWQFGVLCDLVRFYVKDEFDFNVRLTLKASEIPTVALSTQPALSWTTWLSPMRSVNSNGNGYHPSHPEEDPYIVITPEALRADSGSIKSRILSRVPRNLQSELLSLREWTVPKNRVLMRQGEPGVEMYIIRSGKVLLSRCEHHGKETVVGFLGPGDAFGERAMLRRKPYSETALALSDCEISVLTLADLREIIETNPSLRRAIETFQNLEKPETVPYRQFKS